MSLAETAQRAHFGLAGFFFGVGAIIVSMLLISGALLPEPQQSVGTTIGEIARDIKAAATGVFVEDSAPVEPQPKPFDPTTLLMILTSVLAGVAVVLGGISLFQHEPTPLPKYAIGLGIGAVFMQFAFWIAVLICATLILTAIITNIGDIFDL